MVLAMKALPRHPLELHDLGAQGDVEARRCARTAHLDDLEVAVLVLELGLGVAVALVIVEPIDALVAPALGVLDLCLVRDLGLHVAVLVLDLGRDFVDGFAGRCLTAWIPNTLI